MSTIEKAAARLGNRPVAQKPHETEVEDPCQPESDPNSRGTITNIQPSALASNMVEIDVAELVDRGYLSPNSGRSQLAQDLRRIKRPLLLHAQKASVLESSINPANLIMLTSAVPGEGKTFIAINLAISIATELDRRVLLVDGDIAKGDIARQLDIPAERGLSDILQEPSYFSEDGVLTTNIDRLSVLPAGQPHEHTDELFASSLMKEIVQRLAAEDPDRIVVFDAPPLLATTEAAVLASHMGQVVVVVESNNTPQAAVMDALHQVKNCESVSLLLNKSAKGNIGTYGYGYGHHDNTHSSAVSNRA